MSFEYVSNDNSDYFELVVQILINDHDQFQNEMNGKKWANPLVVMALNNFFHGISNYNESISDRKYCHFISFPDLNVKMSW